jgi:NAD(P)H-dependent FMN reductase
LLIGGSLRAGSTNAAVLRTAQTLVPKPMSATLYAGLGELPHFNPDDDREPLPPAVAALRAALSEADAVLFCTPEYAGSLPGSFKNLLDWTVGGGLYGKPVGFINVSAYGAAKGAHETLRVVLGYINAELVESACIQVPVRRDAIGVDGLIADPALRNTITAAVSALAAHLDARE